MNTEYPPKMILIQNGARVCYDDILAICFHHSKTLGLMSSLQAAVLMLRSHPEAIKTALELGIKIPPPGATYVQPVTEQPLADDPAPASGDGASTTDTG